MSPTFTEDGKVLIFSSQRKPSMGGFDYFYATKDLAGKWQKVYNVGYPFNTLVDDIGFSSMLHMNDGVFAKYDPNGNADKSIYWVKLSNFSKFNLIPISGEIRTKGDMSFKGTNLYFVDENTKDTVGTIEEPEGGKYNIDMYPGNFKLLLVKNQVPLLSQSFFIPTDSAMATKGSDFQLVSDLVAPEKQSAKPGTDTLFISDVFFEFNKSEISLQALAEISKMVASIKKHKIVGIEFIGYTDSVGTDMYNMRLSELRAEKVQKIFHEQGIPNKFLSSMGVGAARFLAKNRNSDGTDNTDGRAYNRRVEIYITSMEKNLVIVKRKVTMQ
jgi:outer membrane protein OmpA-like peptidoglycan-associated protein